MEHGTHNEHAAAEPSGSMVREHWANWERFKSMTKFGIIFVGISVVIAVFFVIRCAKC